VTDGCDGTWVAHPGLVPIAREIFDRHMPQPNQYTKQLPDVTVTAANLLDFKPEAPITEAGLRNNVQVGIQYIGSWLGGNGCVPIFNLMEDAATAEISRSQVWQWIRSPKGILADGRKVTKALFHEILVDELKKTPSIVGAEAYAAGKYAEGAKLFEEITASDEYVEFLTLPAYRALA
jgi:malate synthase